jgi:hypothetical protein
MLHGGKVFKNEDFRKYSLPHALRQILPPLILVDFSL